MRFISIWRSLKEKLFRVKPESSVQADASRTVVSPVVGEISSYSRHIRARFQSCVDMCNVFTQQRDVEAIARIHPLLASNLTATLQRDAYVNFFEEAKNTIVDLGNFPQVLSGPGFGTDFVSFELWVRTGQCTSVKFPSDLGAWQPFINLVCSFSEVLSNPKVSLTTRMLPPDILLLAEAVQKDIGWDKPECLSAMHTSSVTAVNQLRSLIRAVIPDIFPEDKFSHAT